MMIFKKKKEKEAPELQMFAIGETIYVKFQIESVSRSWDGNKLRYMLKRGGTKGHESSDYCHADQDEMFTESKGHET